MPTPIQIEPWLIVGELELIVAQDDGIDCEKKVTACIERFVSGHDILRRQPGYQAPADPPENQLRKLLTSRLGRTPAGERLLRDVLKQALSDLKWLTAKSAGGPILH